MNVAVTDRRPDASSPMQNQVQLGIVDCDVHPYTKTAADLDPFLSERPWDTVRKNQSPFPPIPYWTKVQ